MRWLTILIATYLLGYVVFTCCDMVNPAGAWYDAYFIWQSLCDGSLLAWGVIYHYVPMKHQQIVRWPLMLSGVLFAWEIISVVTGIHINNNIAENIVHLLFLGVTTYLVYREIVRINK